MSNSSKFYSSLGLLILLNSLIKPLWIFGIDRQVQNVVGTSVYGIYFSIFNLCVVFSFLLDWGLTIYFNRQAAWQNSYINYTGSFLLIKLFFAILYLAIVSLAAWIAGIERWDILWLVILIQIFTSFFLFLRNLITAQQRFRTDAWLSVLDKTLMILVCGSFLYFPFSFGSISIEKFLLIQVACTGGAIFISIVLLVTGGLKISAPQFSVFNKRLLLAALPFAFIVLLMSMHQRMDGFLLVRLHKNGAYEAGIYATAYRFVDATNMIGYLIASFLLPYIARHWSNRNETDKAILQSRNILMMVTIPVVITGLFLSTWIQKMLYHNEMVYGAVVLKLSLASLVGYSLIQVYGTILTATGYIKSFCFITFLSVALNLVLNLVLIPGYGAIGCSIAALISESSAGLGLLWYVYRKLRVDIHLRSVLIYIFTGVMLYVVLYLGVREQINSWLLLCLVVIITLMITISTKLVTINKLIRQ
ncbi:MAG: polysaccharide biosynthesis C-terminal domain-containing protein [Bacteroidota bacterium]|nr:polysaccharide biosynthesis C-terminal domain-containing protein [Bacteroidota bacterium]